MRSSVALAAALSTTVLLAACGNSSNSTASSGSASGSAAGSASSSSSGSSSAPAGGSSDVKVGMAYDVGGRGDQSFNDAAAAGMDKAKAEFGVQTNESTATAGEAESAREGRLTTLIDGGYNALVAVGFAYAPAVKKVAPEDADTKFALVDSVDASGDNVQNITFAEEQGSYLAGVAAALKSKTKHIGFVGGVQTDLIKKFEAGYVAGAKSVNPSIKIDIKYLTQVPDFSGFGDPAKGKTAAEGMLSSGADIIYHAAGGSGAGVFNAVKAKSGTWAIGVDSDQAKTAQANVRDIILTSMVKRVDLGVYEFIKQVKDGSFKSGVANYDLKSGGVELATTGGHIDDIKAQLDKAKQDIIDGKVTVPTK